MSDQVPLTEIGALVRLEPAPLEASKLSVSSDIAATPQEFRAAEINAVLQQAYLKAGTLAMTPEEVSKLTAPFPRSAIERRENRFNYIPHIHISRRLTEVFGPGQWTMIRRREWIIGNQVNAEWVMIIRGHFIGESIGSQEYHPNNARQNFADVLEATRGECIRRIAGKYLGCGDEVWDPAVARELDAERTRAAMQGAKQISESPRTATETAAEPAAPSPIVATEKTRQWMLVQLKDVHVKMQAWAIDHGLIMPNEGLEDFPLAKVPTNKAALAALRAEIEAHV